MKQELNKTINIISGLTNKIINIKQKTDSLISTDAYGELYSRIDTIEKILNIGNDSPQSDDVEIAADTNGVIPLTLIAAEENSVVVLFDDKSYYTISESITETILYRTSQSLQWKPYTNNQQIQLSNIGDYVQFKNTSKITNIDWIQYTYDFDPGTPQYGSVSLQFEMSGKIKAAGNIQSLNNYLTDSAGNYIVEYQSGFFSLFKNCQSLIEPPELPAIRVDGCGYESLFEGCSNLIKAPILPATTIASDAYNYMFRYCTKIKQITCYFTSWHDEQEYLISQKWVEGVSSDGTFNCLADLPQERGISRIPNSWIINLI